MQLAHPPNCAVHAFQALLASSAVLTLSSPAYADGIDVVWVLTRVGGWRESPLLAALLLIGLMVANYALNAIVVGIPSTRLGAPRRRVLLDLVGFTLIAQIADRVGAIVGGALGVALTMIAGSGGESQLGQATLVAIVANFILSGVFVGMLARYYLIHRWSLTTRWTSAVAVAAGVLTNPAWAMATWMSR
jgi:hypothetical protein